MFEFIGMVVVAWFVFVIVKSVINGGIKGILTHASAIAINKGVPRDFVIAAISNPKTLIKARKTLVKENAELRELDVHEQYAAAIIMSYRIGSQVVTGESVSVEDIQEKIKRFVGPQLTKIENEGLSVNINQITFVYFGALATCMGRISVSATELKDVVKNIFPQEEHRFDIENAYRAAVSKDFWEKLKLMIPVAKKELEAGEGEFFVKYTRKVRVEMEKMFEEDANFDPRNQPLDDFLKV